MDSCPHQQASPSSPSLRSGGPPQGGHNSGGAQQLAVGSVRARRALGATLGSHQRFIQGAVGGNHPLPASPTPFHYVGEEPDKNKTPLRGPLFLWRCGESTNSLALRLTAHRWVRHNPLQEQDPLAGAVVLVEVRGVEPRSSEVLASASPSAADSELVGPGTLSASFLRPYPELVFPRRSRIPARAFLHCDAPDRRGRNPPGGRAAYLGS